MLVYNNKLLMVGGKAIKYIPPRNLSISLQKAASYAWSRKSTSQDNWPSDFGSALWKCSSDMPFWRDSSSAFYRGGITAVGSYDRTALSYIYPAFFQLAASNRLGWFATTTDYSCYMLSGTSTASRSSEFSPQITNKIFDHKVGTFNSDRATYFGW